MIFRGPFQPLGFCDSVMKHILRVPNRTPVTARGAEFNQLLWQYIQNAHLLSHLNLSAITLLAIGSAFIKSPYLKIPLSITSQDSVTLKNLTFSNENSPPFS